MAYDSLHQQPVLFGGNGAGFLNDTWTWIAPIVSLVPQAPVVVNDGKGNYVVTLSLKNQGNVTLTSVTLTTAKLGGVSATALAGPPVNATMAPGAVASFSGRFPIAAVPGKTTTLAFAGGYTSAAGPASTWSVSLRSLNLP